METTLQGVFLSLSVFFLQMEKCGLYQENLFFYIYIKPHINPVRII